MKFSHFGWLSHPLDFHFTSCINKLGQMAAGTPYTNKLGQMAVGTPCMNKLGQITACTPCNN